ncbi:hypothetical protein RN001_002906 [Aquatica leii]|uniref:BESS domain-containing protein n=1 Tax=Aquatica leii TaxID=1421715 RepID=A0AAN7SSX5_9COLE|nr:hypothetical protein RN001_002906 [Aquatica leii]
MKKKTVSGQEASNRKYIYARQMDFLLHCGISSATTTSVDEDTETQTDEYADDPVGEINVAALAEPPARPSSRQSPPLSITPEVTAAKNVPPERKHTASEFSRIPAAKRRVILEEDLLKFLNSTPAETPVQPTDDDKSFFESLLPIVKTLPVDTKLEFRCIVINKLKELRALVYSAQNVPSTTVLMPIHQQDVIVLPQKRHAPTDTPANLNQPLCISLNQQQQAMHNPLQQQFSYINLPTGIVAPRTTEGNVSHIEALQESQTSLLDNDDIEDEQFSDENSANVDFSSQVSVTADVSQEIASADISQVVAKDGISKVNTNRGSLRVNKSPRELVSEATNMSSSSTATSRLKRTSRREENIAVEQQLLNIETKKLALLQTPEDENSLFLRSLLPYFQKMDPLQQLRVRNKFQETLIDEMSPPFTNLQPGNTHYPDRPSTASSVHSSTYSNVCSPPTTSFQAGNTQYYSDCPITAGSSPHLSTYLDVSSLSVNCTRCILCKCC